MDLRRVVSVKDASGKSSIVSDGVSPDVRKLKLSPGFTVTPLWSTKADSRYIYDGKDMASGIPTLLPRPGETMFLALTIPPDASIADQMALSDFDPVAMMAEHFAAAPGIAALMESGEPGMHATPTIDYGVVVDGQIWLEVDAGESIMLGVGDTFVQHGARHAWRNRGDRPATIVFVLVGAN
ncbi:MAG: cupin domain-containing protein [Rhodospirillaceae bacterium]|nr:MAG: cupin domain-containing protein [Rhodospirillaceae bacterium]